MLTLLWSSRRHGVHLVCAAALLTGCSDSKGEGGGTCIAVGGSIATAGALATGGSIATAGALATGGSIATAGAPATGGSIATSATGATAGALATGGSIATSATGATAGALATAGSLATGGSIATAGQHSTGGSIATAGSPAAGGTVAITSIPTGSAGAPFGAAGAGQSGFICNANALAEGLLSPVGIASIDVYFAQVAAHRTAAKAVSTNLIASMDAIKAHLGLPANATGTQVAAAISAKFQLEGGLRIANAPPTCQVSIPDAMGALTRCDGTLTANAVHATCAGRCDGDIQVSGGKLACAGETSLKCTVTSVNFACAGSCKGSCRFPVAAACSGKCVGTCTGTCRNKTASNLCNDKCEGNCQGTCEFPAGGNCTGVCEGDCSVEATGGSCHASAWAECFIEPTSGTSSVACIGQCEGAIALSPASVECSVSAKSDAELRAECAAPAVEVSAKVSSAAGIEVSLAYEAFLSRFETEIAKLVANLRRADLVIDAGYALVDSTPATTTSFKEALRLAGNDANRSARLACAIELIPTLTPAMAVSAALLTESTNSASAFLASFR